MQLPVPLRRALAAAAAPALARLLALSLAALSLGMPAVAETPADARLGLGIGAENVVPAVPDAALAARLFGAPQDGQVIVTRQDTPAPSWPVEAEGRTLGLIGSTWEL